MNSYEEKQERRRERLLNRAEKAEAESDRRWQASHDAVAHIPLGQPILVGHHSEKGHRADLARCHRHADKSIEEKNKAAYYRQKAASVGKGGISSDDPDAITKLSARLEKMKKKRELLKRLNALWRKAGRPAPEKPELWEALEKEIGIDLAPVRSSMMTCTWEKNPVPSFELSNLGANIKRIEKRIADLEQTESEPAQPDRVFDGFRITEDKEDNRILVTFGEKPPRETCRMMRQYGFRWSPTRVAWVRHLNSAGRQAATWILERLEGGTR